MPQRTTTTPTDHRVLIIVLRIVGVMACLAIVASVMPTTWIAATHRWFGLGDFPDQPITQYLARSLSAFYALFGVLTIFVSTDVRRYAPIIYFLAYSTLAFGVLIIGIDLMAGMPKDWTLCEGPMALVLGLVILLLARRVKPSEGGRPS